MQQDRNKYNCNGTGCSETSETKIQTPEFRPKERNLHLEQGESLKSSIQLLSVNEWVLT
jgi:hypothetical protein